MNRIADSPSLPRAALLVLLTLAAAPAAPAADDVTSYKIRNRWLPDQCLHDDHSTVAYGAGDDATYRWTLEGDGALRRVRNADTGGYMVLSADGKVATTKVPPTAPSGQWEVEVGTAPFRSLKNAASGKYLSCERKLGHVECDLASLPKGDNWWSGQWEFVHAGGPPPPRYFRRNQVAVTMPPYASAVRGDTLVEFFAPGLTAATVKCWKQGEGFGSDATVADLKLDVQGKGSFVFPADDFPHGPITLRISATDGAVRDNCYLQLYNQRGVRWNEGLPKDPPPPAGGMTLAFADDFTGPLSISGTDPKATYYDHKPPGGIQDFSTLTFTSHDSPKSPFAQVGSYLRIRASEKTHTAGLLSSMKNDASGLKVSPPCYFEARFLGPNAVGTWPGFWLMTDYMTDYKLKGDKTPCDELDILEAYGGEGPGSPNADDKYMVTPHCWNQGEEGKARETKAYEGIKNPVQMRKFGIPSTWFEAFHTYGCKVTEADTIYYCDNVEVGRHPTFPVSRERPLFFMINLATGGGWPVDLSRYDGVADMYIDYIRVYKK